MFLLINLGERAGSGLPKIRSGWQQAGHALRLFVSFEPFDQTVLEMDWAPGGGESAGRHPGPAARGSGLDDRASCRSPGTLRQRD